MSTEDLRRGVKRVRRHELQAKLSTRQASFFGGVPGDAAVASVLPQSSALVDALPEAKSRSPPIRLDGSCEQVVADGVGESRSPSQYRRLP